MANQMVLLREEDTEVDGKKSPVSISSTRIRVIEARVTRCASDYGPIKDTTQYMDLDGNLLAEKVRYGDEEEQKKNVDHAAEKPTTNQPEKINVSILKAKDNVLMVGNEQICISGYTIEEKDNGELEMTVKIPGQAHFSEILAIPVKA